MTCLKSEANAPKNQPPMHYNHANEVTSVVQGLLVVEWLANISLLKFIYRDIRLCKLTFSIIFKTTLKKSPLQKASKIQNNLEATARNLGKEDNSGFLYCTK